jgi:ATP-dependent 26S proteasome regulatory subunit
MHLFEQAGLGSNRGVLVAGPPGTGKTAACRVLAAEVLERATAIFVDSMIAQALLPSLYQEISGLGPTLVLVEDLDLIVGSRDDETARRPLLDFLTVLDGLMTQHRNVVTVATTNDPAAVDAGVRRAARFDRVVMFPIPDEDGRRRILDVYLASVPHEVDTRAVARATDGATGADLREYVRGALLTASDVVTTADVLATIEPGHDAPDRTSPRTAGKYL